MALRKFLFGTGVVSGTSYLALKYTETGEGFYRFGSTVYWATHVVVDYKWDKYKDPDTPTRMKKELHQRSADRILGLCKQHGGILIKAGQYVGTMNHVLPKEYTSTLSKLQDNAPTLPFEKIKPVLLESLNVNNLDEIFDEMRKGDRVRYFVDVYYDTMLPSSGDPEKDKILAEKMARADMMNLKNREYIIGPVELRGYYR